MLLNLNVKCTAPYMPAKKLQHLSIAVSTELLEDIDHILELHKWFRPSTSKSSKLLDNIVVAYFIQILHYTVGSKIKITNLI